MRNRDLVKLRTLGRVSVFLFALINARPYLCRFGVCTNTDRPGGAYSPAGDVTAIPTATGKLA